MSNDILERKLKYWEHQLLDLGKRNRMINYRETKRGTIKLVEPEFTELYSRIADKEEELTFQRLIDREADVRVYSVLSLLENLSAPLPVSVGDIKTDCSYIERQKTLKNLRSKSKLSLEEQGTNILYLSFGFIEWRDGKGASAQIIKSPLILVPAVLTLESLNSPYVLKKHEDDIVLNPTLEYYLKTEYGVELPPFDADEDDIDEYLSSLEETASKLGGRIHREVSLGLLSFLKISMYNDLLRNEERIKQSPVIRAMAGDNTEANDIPEHLQGFDLDSIGTQDCYQVMSADSSQQDAILYSKNNISFVMQGPPGTGKSQTITNIIAEALAEGKKVLFVSEKMAALQVVYRRLQDAHLGEFCLPLHSYKANKKEILEQIGANLNLNKTKVKDSAISNLDELMAIRQELNRYASELHTANSKLNLSCYEVYSKLEKLIDAPTVSFELNEPLEISQSELQGLINALSEYSLALERLGYSTNNNPWEGLSARSSGYEYSEQMRKELEVAASSVNSIIDLLRDISEADELSETTVYSDIPKLSEFITNTCQMPQLPEIWTGDYDCDKGIHIAEEAKNLCLENAKARDEISKVFSDKIFSFDYNGWRNGLFGIAERLADLPLLNRYSSDYFISQAHILQPHFEVVKMNLVNAIGACDIINQRLGTGFSANTTNQQILGSLISLMSNNTILVKAWFAEDTDSIIKYIEYAKTIAAEIKCLKDKLLSDWEPEILSLDYSPMLMRYKSEYTGILKNLNSQYKNDKKQLQVLSKTVIKKLTDEIAIDVLTTLKSYHDKKNWFISESARLSTLLGGYYKEADSSWDEIISALEICKAIKELPLGQVSENVMEIMSAEHSDKLSVLRELHSSMSSFTSTAEAELKNLGSNVDISAMEASEVLSNVDLYMEGFAEISSHREAIKPYLVNSNEQINTVCTTIEKINSYNNTIRTFEDKTEVYRINFERLFDGEDTDWNSIISLLMRYSELMKSEYAVKLSGLINIAESRKKELLSLTEKINTSYKTSVPSLNWINSQFTADTELFSMTLRELSVKISSCIDNISGLENWVDYLEAKQKCADTVLNDFICKTENSGIFRELEKVFLKGFYRMWLEAVCESLSSVRRFRRNAQDERIRKFTELDDKQLSIAQMRIREKLIADFPTTHHMLKATDEVAILNKELGKKRRIMPLRKLFRMIPNLLMKLKPCLMMSPLSVSYFLETEAYHFDLVIFDEASQIFPEDAIGAIFRGSQVIIAGDSKQMPPTNFFSSKANNIDGDYDNEDEESDEIVSDSILEEASAVLPSRTLLWHYRSKHESLIAFSNREIYSNNLVTFPDAAINAKDMGVEYIYLEDGVYDRGGKRNNLKEAEECVRLVAEHIEKHPKRSLGIIAFSESQQATIENAITEYRESNPENEWFFDETRDEPFFVKNLENVQGDERDSIIFSICYGKDKDGKMYRNFGPVGHNGGERRLNVAITRAKRNIKLVGSIMPSDIETTESTPEGTKMLRSYIEYAIKGTSALRPVENSEAFEGEDEFCDIVAEFIEANGYKAVRQVGCSSYKIDIAVINPSSEGEYIAGIECDGMSYIHAKTARDRDHLRKSVLKNMGWNLYRVWSTEWSRNPQTEQEALLAFLKELTENKDNEISTSTGAPSDEDIATEEPASETADKSIEAVAGNPYGFSYYTEADWKVARHSGYGDSLTVTAENVLHIVSIEQPVHIEVLYKRLGPSFTTGKATESVRYTIDRAIEQNLSGRAIVDEEGFVRLLPVEPVKVRISKDGDTPRPIEYIHTEEIANAMLKIIESSFGLTEDDLTSECAYVFGFERKGPKIKTKTDAAIKLLTESNRIRFIDGKAQLIGE